MVKKLLFFFIILGFCSVCYSQNFTGGFVDFGSNHSNSTYNDTTNFGTIFNSSTVTVQNALDILESSGVTAITACQTSDNFCFVFSEVDQQLTLWVGGSSQVIWPSVSAAVDSFVLRNTGDFVLRNDGSKIQRNGS